MKMKNFNKNLGGSQRYAGFTLAEVLITLGIIGIVAAMTIPTLINNSRKAGLESGFKKSYSMIQNAYEKAYFDNGGKALDFSNADDITLFFSNFQIASSTKPAGYATRYFDSTSSLTIVRQNGDYADFAFLPPKYPSYVLADGSMIGIFSGSGNGWPTILVDTNGTRGPNRLGYDVFTFTNAVKGNILTAAGSGQWNPPDWIDHNHCTPVDKGGNASGYTCTYYAVLNQCAWDSSKKYWESLP